MDVDFERRLIADDEQRVAERLELLLDRIPIEPRSLHDEDGAVAIPRRFEMDRVGTGRGRSHRRGEDRLAGDRSGQPTKELDESRTACVDNAGLA